MLWKIYFYVYSFLSLAGLLYLLPQLPTFNLSSLETVIETIFLILGLYAFIYNKKNLLSHNVWKGIFYSILTIWIVQLIVYANAIPFITPYLAFLKTSFVQSYSEVALSVIISIPALFAIYKLGFTKK